MPEALIATLDIGCPDLIACFSYLRLLMGFQRSLKCSRWVAKWNQDEINEIETVSVRQSLWAMMR